MGAFLEKPKTEKTTVSGEGYGIRYAVSAMQGWRMEMEDAHVCYSADTWSFFGVFDGHAGPKVSKYCAENIKDIIMGQLPQGDSSDVPSINVSEVETAIVKGFLKLDEEIRGHPQWANGEDHSGSTAITVMILPTHIIWANCGDSRGVLCRSGQLHFATVDHKPFSEGEKQRIEKAGGTVMMQRVNGSLAVSRALGDFDYKRNSSLDAKEQLVSPEPEVTVLERKNELDEFLLLACDGIYDVMSNEEVVEYVRHRLELTSDLGRICNDLIDTCLHKNSRDNMSVILVVFPNAPKVSQEAIDKEKKLQEEAIEKIMMRLQEMVRAAHDPLEIEENYVIQQLTLDLPSNYDVAGKRPMISEKLQELTKEKFGEMEGDGDFAGHSDPSMAPVEFSNAGQGAMIDDNDFPSDDLLLKSNNAAVVEDKEIEESHKEEEMEVTPEEGHQKPEESEVKETIDEGQT